MNIRKINKSIPMKKLFLIPFLFINISDSAQEIVFDITQVQEIREIDRLTKKASEGDGESAYKAGRMYLLGNGITKNEAAAFIWFEKGAKSGSIDSQVMLARCKTWGWGTKRNLTEALDYLRTPLRKNDSFAILTLFQILDESIDSPEAETNLELINSIEKLFLSHIEIMKFTHNATLEKECAPIIEKIKRKIKDSKSIIKSFSVSSDRRQNHERTPQSELPREKTLDVLSKGIKKTNESANYVYYSWKAEILNTTGRDIKVVCKLVIKDSSGYQIDYTYSDRKVIPSRERRTITSQGMLEKHLWQPGNTIEVIPRETNF